MRKIRLHKTALRFIKITLLIALLADFIANDKPIAIGVNGNTHFPILKSYGVNLGITSWEKELQFVDWKTIDYDWIVRTPIPYAPNLTDKENDLAKSPFGEQTLKSTYYRHWLGTNEAGQDILSGIIHGIRTALMIGLFSMLIAGLIGIILGAAAGYFGDHQLKMTWVEILFLLIGLIPAWFYGFTVRNYILSDAFSGKYGNFTLNLLGSIFIFTIILFLFFWTGKGIQSILKLKKSVNVPVDIIISRFIEIFTSFPTLFFIITLIAMNDKPSLSLIIWIIGLVGWPSIAKLVRADMLRVREQDFIASAKNLGLSNYQIVLKHALPNALNSSLVALAFGIASTVLLESYLSFLGGILPEGLTSWGGFIAEVKDNPKAWWLALFPGILIFLTVYYYNKIGENIRHHYRNAQG